MELLKDVPCPFCGLGCDDLALRGDGDAFAVDTGGCPRSRAGFARAAAVPAARVGGREVSTQEALAEAVRLLSAARQPLITGLATDIAGARSALNVARHCNGIVDHAHGIGAMTAALAMQSGGGMNASLSEIKNRAGLVILVGTNGDDVAPRFLERCLAHPEHPFLPDTPRHVVVLGAPDQSRSGQQAHPELRWEYIDCKLEDRMAVIGALRCLIEGKSLDASASQGLPMAELKALAAAIGEVDYGAIVSGPHRLAGGHGDLVSEAIQALLQSLNVEKRWGGLSLGGSEGAATVQEVCTWTSGYPGRFRYRAGEALYEPWLLDGASLLASGEADCMLWVGGLEDPSSPPDSAAPSIVLAPAYVALAREPEVYLPVGIPGLDHSGTAVRCDHVVSLPLRQLRTGGAPAAALALDAIYKALLGQEVAAC